ncbi:hypothetical protein pb186bvf_009023 [Paramecium bursaria]
MIFILLELSLHMMIEICIQAYSDGLYDLIVFCFYILVISYILHAAITTVYLFEVSIICLLAQMI